jgi:cytochrome c biogenesis protein CcmG/thiol:disulfide interchange protein DsbE
MLIGLAAALVATVALLQLARSLSPAGSPGPSVPGLLAKNQPAPAITGTTLDGQQFDLASLRGRPVIVNFWGPSCVPCRDEFPLLLAKLGAHETDGLAVIGVLMYDSPAPALEFIRQYKATWPTVNDPTGAIRTTYRVAARPQSYFIDRDGLLRSIQVGQLTDAEFDKQYVLIAGGGSATGGAPSPSLQVPPSP